MEKIEQKINGYIRALMGGTGMLILLGVVFFVFPGFILSILRWGMAVILFLIGAGVIARAMSRGRSTGTVTGIIFVLLGLLIATHPETLNIVMIVLGLYMIITSVSSLVFMQNVKNPTIHTLSIVSSVIGLVCGVIMFVHPGESTEAMLQIAGIILCVYGVSGLIEMITVKVKFDDVMTGFKTAKKTANKMLEDAKEAEIVEKKSKKKSK